MHATFLNGKFKEMEDMYVIFITETDVLKQDLPIYHVERTMKETNEDFNDGMHIVYVNASKQEDTAIGHLMHDFNCTRAGDMYYEALRNRVQYYKEDEGGIRMMCKIWDEVRQEGIEQGIEQEKIQTATNLWKEGIQDLELIQKVSGLPLEKVKGILKIQ